MDRYEITLRNDKLRSYNRITWFIIAIHIVALLYFSLFSTDKRSRVSAIIVLGLLGLWFFLYFYYKKTKWQVSYHPFFYLLTMGFICMEQYWLALVPFVFDLLFITATRELIVSYSIEAISYPSFPKKKIDWNELTNTVLKDGLLTIDFKSNKMIQQAIDETKTSVNEQDFNEFCKKQLISHKSQNSDVAKG